MNMAQAEEHGRKLGLDHLKLVHAAHGDKIAAMVAGSLAMGARDWIIQRYGSRTAYDLCQGLADECVGNESVKL
jgi:hypothetical protein